MHITKPKIFAVTSCAVLLLAGLFSRQSVPGTTQSQTRSRNGDSAKTVIQTPAPGKSSQRPYSSERTEPKDSDRTDILADLLRRWDETVKSNTGEALLAKQHDLAMEAVKLGGSGELLSFLKFLNEMGATDLREQLLTGGIAEVFAGANAKETRNWLVTVKDLKLREKLCYLAGKNFTGDGLKEYIAAFHPDDHSQSAFLVGYCRELAQSDPEGAVKKFIEFRPSNVTYDGYVEIMAALPPTANFAKLSSEIPDDSQGLAGKARKALLQSWSATRPEEAAQYVLSNSKLAFPAQMGVVVEKWAATSPDAAAAWIDALSPGKPRDEGTAALTRNWTASDPIKAWEFAGKVGDLNKRVEVATAVFNEWIKTDRAAATNAWVALFPPAN